MPGPAEDAERPTRQRVAAYAVLTRGSGPDLQVLLTRMSSRTRIEGFWTLPGGGIDHGEDPRDAVRREVHEETGLHVEPGRVLDVHSTHFTGPRADGLVEDYHGVHLIYRAELLPDSVDVPPRVLEADSSTDLSAWVGFAEASALPLLGAARHALDLVLDEHAPGPGQPTA